MIAKIVFTSEQAKEKYTAEPFYGSNDAAGFDLRAAIEKPLVLLPSEQAMIPTGIKIQMANPYASDIESPTLKVAAIALPRSGRGSKDGLVLGNTAGVIDQDYTGEIMLCCWARPTDGHVNIGNARIGGKPVMIEPWQRIAQLVIVPVFRPDFEISESISETDRGSGGFGSTGI